MIRTARKTAATFAATVTVAVGTVMATPVAALAGTTWK